MEAENAQFLLDVYKITAVLILSAAHYHRLSSTEMKRFYSAVTPVSLGIGTRMPFRTFIE